MTIAPCDRCTGPNWSEDGISWCSFPVELPYNLWAELCHKKEDADKKTVAALQNISIWLVESEEDLGPALEALYNSMRDPIIGIDTEWKFDTKTSENAVALISLASSSTVVLIRTCNFCCIPKEVRSFCRDDDIVGVAFAWDLSDERKMQQSFGVGRRELFSHFVDLQPLADKYGYNNVSINSLAKYCLGFEPPKSQHVTMSDWEASILNPKQLRYAALDSLVAADCFRALRLYHQHNPDCPGCDVKLGIAPKVEELLCGDVGCKKKAFGSIAALMAHTKSTGHVSNLQKCVSCGRVSNFYGNQHGASKTQHKPPVVTPTIKKPGLAAPDPGQQAQVNPENSLETVMEQSLTLQTVDEPPEYPAPEKSGKHKYKPVSRSRSKKREGSMYAAYNSFV